MDTVKVKALQPIVGAYPCSAGEADHIANVLGEDDQGNIVTKRVAYKKYQAKIETDRFASPQDIEDEEQREKREGDSFVPRLSADKTRITVPADPEFLELPRDEADKLVARGLVEIIGGQLKPRKAVKHDG